MGYTVNANGNLVARGPDTFGYDQANRLKSATVGSTTSTYGYDGDGKRASATVGANPATSYLHDVNRSLPVLLEDGSRKYVWGLGLAYAVDGAGAIEVHHTDRLGSVRAITDGSGQVVQTYTYDEYGVQTGAQGTSGQSFGYTGEPRDGTGLQYLRARYYDPESGRFLSQDPVVGAPAMPTTLHRYAYVRNNPVNVTDPSGLCGVDVAVDAFFIGYDLYRLVSDNILGGNDKALAENLAALGGDIAGAALPCATGLGAAKCRLRQFRMPAGSSRGRCRPEYRWCAG